jgi:serine/threonine-protein kinase HipA
MAMRKCLYCYQALTDGHEDFHPACSRKIFGLIAPPTLAYSEDDLERLAREVIQSQTTVTGVQAKLSLHITSDSKEAKTKRFTIVGIRGGYILKPPTTRYAQLPEVEDLTMHLASLVKIKTAPHSLIRLQSGNLAYVTKRIDRVDQRKLAMEDMCQLTERMTEDKYQGSYEQIAKTILKYSSNPGLDVVNFFELVLFSFLTGNADMHLKNFSLLAQDGIGMTLSPAYDLVNTTLVNPADEEELALNLNGKKKKIKKHDFVKAMTGQNLDLKQQANIFNKMIQAYPAWIALINKSFLRDEFKDRYASIIRERMIRINE